MILIRIGTVMIRNDCLYTRTNMHINQESGASRLSMSLLGEQRLPLGTRKLHWLPIWTLRAPLTGRPSRALQRRGVEPTLTM
ncbi:hypothetical protein Trydic_g16462 [Trypoxylus dichotomus]